LLVIATGRSSFVCKHLTTKHLDFSLLTIRFRLAFFIFNFSFLITLLRLLFTINLKSGILSGSGDPYNKFRRSADPPAQ
jgi:hypothetical protein